jgi:hypothetical protein
MLADRAGALAQVATVIGMHGGNIASIDVLSSGGDSAVDDLVVEFSGEPDFPELADDLLTDAGARLMSHQPAEVGDPVESSLRLAGLVATRPGSDQTGAAAPGVAGTAASGAAVAAVAQALATLTWATRFWVLGTAGGALDGSGPEPGAPPPPGHIESIVGGIGAPAAAEVLAACRQTLISGRPVAFAGHGWLDPALGDDPCLLAVGVPRGDDSGPVVLLARPSPNEFTVTEQGRVEAFVALYQHFS